MKYEFLKRNKNLLILSTLYIITLLNILFFLIYSIKNGGNGWTQGDWLINNEIQIIRRGWFGSFILFLSENLSLNPLYLLGLIQSIIIFFIFYSVWKASIKLDINNNDALFFLLISPLFFIFWGATVGGSLRKEIITYLAFTPYLFYFMSNRENYKFYLFTSILIYFIAVFSHEANVFFLPFFIATLILIFKKDRTKLIFFSIIYCVISLSAFIYSIIYNKVNDYMDICNPILKFGIDSSICKGAISWLDTDLDYNLSLTSKLLLSSSLFYFILSYFLSIFIFIVLIKKYFNIKTILIISFLSSIAFLPLYIVAVDWGRWINFYVVSLTFLIIFWMLKNDILIKYKFSELKYNCLLIFFLSWGVTVVGGEFTIRNGFITGIIFRIGKLLGIVPMDF